jgi:AcrR family transcriptional regulator
MTAERDARRGANTQTQILQAAHQRFIRQGYHGTSMREIAIDAEIALGGIYNHYPSKEDLFVAALEAYHPYHAMLPVLSNASGETVEMFVRNAAAGMIEALNQRPDFLNLMLIEIVEFNSTHLPQLYNVLYPQVMEIVERFAEKEATLRNVPLPIIVRTFIGLFFSHFIIENLIGDQFPVTMRAGALEFAVDIFLHGIVHSD